MTKLEYWISKETLHKDTELYSVNPKSKNPFADAQILAYKKRGSPDWVKTIEGSWISIVRNHSFLLPSDCYKISKGEAVAILLQANQETQPW